MKRPHTMHEALFAVRVKPLEPHERILFKGLGLEQARGKIEIVLKDGGRAEMIYGGHRAVVTDFQAESRLAGFLLSETILAVARARGALQVELGAKSQQATPYFDDVPQFAGRYLTLTQKELETSIELPFLSRGQQQHQSFDRDL